MSEHHEYDIRPYYDENDIKKSFSYGYWWGVGSGIVGTVILIFIFEEVVLALLGH